MYQAGGPVAGARAVFGIGIAGGNAERSERRGAIVSTSVIAVIAVAVMVSIAAYLFGTMVASIRKEKRKENLRKTWANFGLSIAFATLFFISWLVHGFAQWDTYRQEQLEHGEPVDVAGFITDFAHSTLENWQSEFLQLFSFVVLAAVYIHHGSAESKDSEDRIERKIDEIKQRLDDMSRR
jgi:hypothetical protein